jgi:excisionase family DNA binding protein
MSKTHLTVEELKDHNGWLAVKEIAEVLGVHYITIYDWVKKGEIPHRRIGRRIRFQGRVIWQWLERRSIGAMEAKIPQIA